MKRAALEVLVSHGVGALTHLPSVTHVPTMNVHCHSLGTFDHSNGIAEFHTSDGYPIAPPLVGYLHRE
jgi:hypothetical protein